VSDVVLTVAEAAAAARAPLLVLEPLRAFLDERGLGSGELRAEPIGEGRSNVIFRLSRDDREFVLRRPPRPPIPPSAHDVLREARILSALEGTPTRTPAVLAACDDESVIGAPFYVMEKIDGWVLTDDVPAALDAPTERTRIGEELIDALVEVHAVEWQSLPALAAMARGSGYLDRQLRRFHGLWEHNRTREIAAVDRVGAWLIEHKPPSPPDTIVHGDYRLGNVVFAPAAPAALVAVLDWEMATIGDPLADLGYLCTLWVDRDDPPRGLYELSGVTRREGFYRRADLLARYEARSGRTMTDMGFYQALALWKSAIFMEGNYARALAGATDDPYLHNFGDGVIELAERALAFTRA
jgi:aminoglycoside phosphotransferase (APT) family kinase protein